MANFSWYQPLVVSSTAGSAVTGTSAASILAGVQKYTYPANQLVLNSKLRIKMGGKITSAGASPGTLTLDVRFGSVIVFNGGASATLSTSQVNVTWNAEIELICLTTGSGTSATMGGRGQCDSVVFPSPGHYYMPATSPMAAGTGFDSTSSFVIDVFATLGSASDTITLSDYELISVN